MTDPIMCVRGRGARGKEHIAVPPDAGTSLWSRTVCGLTTQPQFPGYWRQATEDDKCWNCKAFHELNALNPTTTGASDV